MPEQTISVLRTVDDRVIPAAGVYAIDAPHTSVEFVARHLMITKVRGRFSDVRGQITIAEDPKDSHVEVEIDVASVTKSLVGTAMFLIGSFTIGRANAVMNKQF